MHEGKPIFAVTPIFEAWLHPPETPDQMKATVPLPEPSRVEAPKIPAAPSQPLIKTYPTGSPQDRTVGIEGVSNKWSA